MLTNRLISIVFRLVGAACLTGCTPAVPPPQSKMTLATSTVAATQPDARAAAYLWMPTNSFFWHEDIPLTKAGRDYFGLDELNASESDGLLRPRGVQILTCDLKELYALSLANNARSTYTLTVKRRDPDTPSDPIHFEIIGPH